ncbi:MAG TPA: hypothetical protein VHX61_11940 [Rhizomicrobium sp.]|nr:hypothetical protein [Rhizomicrobium sp.]
MNKPRTDEDRQFAAAPVLGRDGVFAHGGRAQQLPGTAAGVPASRQRKFGLH